MEHIVRGLGYGCKLCAELGGTSATGTMINHKLTGMLRQIVWVKLRKICSSVVENQKGLTGMLIYINHKKLIITYY